MEVLSLIRECLKEALTIIDKSQSGAPEFTPIEELNLSTRAYNCLFRRGVKYIEQLFWISRDDMLRTRNMGKATFEEINNKVKAIGMRGWE